ncbi:hypothetical protein LOS8367_03195 [Limimaricola soesokkakensis]|uniref:Uncharacterized protein n=1 Tax=Limimaricola soesokkakensis TaxID=1343159 RepID=A0A1X6ZXR3_9RHOB|nr:hypothetical protein LOS8367_03195 [Limimaricola soesokkakensis]
MRARQALDRFVAIQGRVLVRRDGRLVEGRQVQVGIDRAAPDVADPVEAGHALVAGDADRADHDVVATLGHELIEAVAAEEDVVAGDGVGAEGVRVVAHRAVLAAALEPVVSLAADRRLVGGGAEDEVVARSREDLREVLAGDDEVGAATADDQVPAGATMDDVVAVIALDDVVATEIGDDVVAGAAVDVVVAVAAFDAVIATVAPDRVVADAGDQRVIAFGAAEHHVVATGELQRVLVGADHQLVHLRVEERRLERVIAAHPVVVLLGLVDL